MERGPSPRRRGRARPRCRRVRVADARPAPGGPGRGAVDQDLRGRRRAAHHAACRPEPRDRALGPDAQAAAGRGGRHRGRALLAPHRRRHQGRGSGRVGRRHAREGRPGRIDDHRAVRQERAGRPGTDRAPQAPGGGPRLPAGAQDREGQDPRGLPQHDLLRERCLRRAVCGRDLLRRVRGQADAAAVGIAGRSHPLAQQLRPLRPRRRRVLSARRRARQDGVPAHDQRPGGGRRQGRIPRRRAQAGIRDLPGAVLRRGRQAADPRRSPLRRGAVTGRAPAEPVQRRPARLHHRRPRQAGRSRAGRGQGPVPTGS